MPRSTSAVLLGLVLATLAASLGLNAYQWSTPSAPNPSVDAKDAAGVPAQDPVCAAQLDSCLRTANGLAAGIWSMHAPALSPSAPPPPSTSFDGGALGRDALCQVARGKMREEWLQKRDLISGAMLDYLHDEAKQREDARLGAQRVADGLGLDGRARRGFEADYMALEHRYDADIAAMAANGTPDWASMIDGVHSLYENEDAHVMSQLGADKLAAIRQLEADKRVTILSILATYANSDWDEAVQDYGTP